VARVGLSAAYYFMFFTGVLYFLLQEGTLRESVWGGAVFALSMGVFGLIQMIHIEPEEFSREFPPDQGPGRRGRL
jgi:hypothetical protein